MRSPHAFHFAAVVLAVSCGFARLAAAQDTDLLKGDWVGSYRCRQGLTAVVVSLTPERDNAVSGSFTFGNLPGRDNAANGKYLLVGTYDGASHTLKMRPGGWVRQPKGYSPVGFTATLDPASQRLTGSVAFSGCSTIALQKVAAAPAAGDDPALAVKPATKDSGKNDTPH